jgi:peptidoglycan/xylan/chitin deacetylase (PgdA/CDA1 family)
MPLWKRLLLQLYCQASMPVRRLIYRRFQAQRRVPIAVLFYHRVADDLATDWTISNRQFAEQIDWLRTRFDLISLEEVQRRLRHGNERPAVHITFDDGYADNCHSAIPMLVRERIPCTYFVTLQNLLDGRPFEHDLNDGCRPEVNNVEQVRAMAAAGIEIGAHTYSHCDLGKVRDPDLLAREVVTARDELAEVIGRPIRYFSFPFGMHVNLSRAAFAMAADAGYEAVCSAYGGFNYPGENVFHLQRIPADNEIVRLKNWLSGDPRKLSVRRYEYFGGDDDGNEVAGLQPVHSA